MICQCPQRCGDVALVSLTAAQDDSLNGPMPFGMRGSSDGKEAKGVEAGNNRTRQRKASIAIDDGQSGTARSSSIHSEVVCPGVECKQKPGCQQRPRSRFAQVGGQGVQGEHGGQLPDQFAHYLRYPAANLLYDPTHLPACTSLAHWLIPDHTLR